MSWYRVTEQADFKFNLDAYLYEARITGPVEVEHHSENNGNGTTAFWWEVVDRLRGDPDGGRQIAHCSNFEDAELIAFLLNKALNEFYDAIDARDQAEGEV